MTSATVGGKTYYFTYDSNGLRKTKTVDGVTTTYYYDGGLLIAEQNENETIVYIYDANGSPIGMQYRLSTYEEGAWDVYWYEKNLLGDVVGIYNSTGTRIATYSYNSYGLFIASPHTTEGQSIVAKNPLRYRGYYFDNDLDLYYLQSRYYDYRICRFISPDAVEYLGANGDLMSYNLYAYCSNNPVMFRDDSGHENKPTFIQWFMQYVVYPVINGSTDPQREYTKEKAKEKLAEELSGDDMKEVTVSFSQSSIKITNSYQVKDYNTMYRCCEVISKTEGSVRSADNLFAEWVLHNIAAEIFDEGSSDYMRAKDVDLDRYADRDTFVFSGTLLVQALQIGRSDN